MNTNRFLNLLVLALILAGTYPLLALETGEKAPPFVNPDLNKQFVWSKNYLAKGWVVVDFFATDCEGCKKELPILEQLLSDFAESGLAIFVLATDAEGGNVVAPYFRENPTTLTILVDRYQVAVKKYQVTEIPSLFLVDPLGDIVFKEVGFQPDLYEKISAVLNQDQ